MSSGVKLVLTCWFLGFLATLGILWAIEATPRFAKVVGFPLWIITDGLGIGGHDMGVIPVLYIFSPLLYGALLIGGFKFVRSAIRRRRGKQT
jgi:hypothetical protein